MRLQTLFATGLCLLLTAAAFGQRRELKVGDAAPGLDIEEWVKGDEIGIESGNVYLVEFWATWCVPCRKSIPHLTELQKEYGDRGFMVIGVSTEETEVVSNFVKNQGSKMDYTVAVDRRGVTNRAWMSAAGRKGIPSAFLVDRTGKLAFIGNPLSDAQELDSVLRRVIRGRFDPALEAQAKPALEAARNARKVRTYRMALRHYDEIIELSPTVFADVALERFEMILVDMDDHDGAYDYARNQLMGLHFADDGDGLRMLAEKIVLDPKIERPEDRDLDVALEAAQAAMAVDGRSNPEAYATLALVRFHRGELKDAVKLQRRAWMLAKPKHKAGFKRVLDTYHEAADRLS